MTIKISAASNAICILKWLKAWRILQSNWLSDPAQHHEPENGAAAPLSVTHPRIGTSRQGDSPLTYIYIFFFVLVAVCFVSESVRPCQEELKDLRPPHPPTTNLVQAWPCLVLMDNQHSISGWHFPAAHQLLCPCAGVMFRPVIMPWPFAWHGDKQHKKPVSKRPGTLQNLLRVFNCCKLNQLWNSNGMAAIILALLIKLKGTSLYINCNKKSYNMPIAILDSSGATTNH